ncbi:MULTISPECIES: energy transducer TonB [Acidobacteriaceae]|uniref:energy transducer TonB n=1 Tax=Acidobacteriaceae TaxID=204434 RepID=UPI00131DFF3A|nr:MULTISPECIES: energy transducer TonB [Acidobacteriaceae]MDW5267960.1 energy transducer TonB [Edaphobacter sp.]
MTFSIGRYLVAGALLVSFGRLHAEDGAAISARLQSADATTALDDATLRPWHLKVSFQLFDAKGQPTEQGTLEEWWAGQDKDKRIFTSPSYTATEIQTKDGLYRSTGVGAAPEMLDTVREQVVHPMPSKDDEAGAKPELRQQNFGKVPLDCIMLSQPIKDAPFAPLGLFPTYCLDRDKDTLRASFDFGSLLIIRNSLGVFQTRTVATAITAKMNDVTVMSSHVEKLDTASLPDIDFMPATKLEKITNAVRVGSGVIAGQRLSSTPPHYPEGARARHATGTVVMRALISSDGHIYRLRLVSVPDPELAIAALAAVRQWTYKPYLLNGEPVTVDTTITVNFAISN